MQQQLNVELNIPVPTDSVLISKVEFEELKQQELTGVYWSMADLEERTGKKRNWLKEHFLFQPRFRKQLDVENGGFVYYPKNQGQSWSFHAKKMAKFLDDNFHRIFR